MIQSSKLILNQTESVLFKFTTNGHDIIFVGDQNRVEKLRSFFDSIEFSTQREFKTCKPEFIKGEKRLTVMSIGPDNIDIVMNELDALVNIDLETREIK
jgi:uridine phosphorylase